LRRDAAPTESWVETGRLAELGLLTAELLHEVRQPVFAIKALAQLLETTANDPARERLLLLLGQVEVLERVIDRYAGNGRPASALVTSMALGPAVESGVLLLKHRADSRGVALLFETIEGGGVIRGEQAAIQQVMTVITAPSEREERRDFVPAQRTVMKLHRDGALGEGALLNFARAFKYEESIAALSAMTGVKVETLDRLISGDRFDPILIAGKAIDVEWATVRALIMLRTGPNRAASPAEIEDARVNYARLMPATAQRVVAFWKTR